MFRYVLFCSRVHQAKVVSLSFTVDQISVFLNVPSVIRNIINHYCQWWLYLLHVITWWGNNDDTQTSCSCKIYYTLPSAEAWYLLKLWCYISVNRADLNKLNNISQYLWALNKEVFSLIERKHFLFNTETKLYRKQGGKYIKSTEQFTIKPTLLYLQNNNSFGLRNSTF